VFLKFTVDVLTCVRLIIAELGDEVSVVVNCYNVQSAIPFCCKSGVNESYFIEQCLVMKITELYFLTFGDIMDYLATLHQL
jgi:hypothetical protein